MCIRDSSKYKAFLIACGNASQYGNNAYIAPQATLTDGLLDVTILEPFTVSVSYTHLDVYKRQHGALRLW